jgi:hypothetical protein
VGCGYGLVRRDAALPTSGRRVFAPTFKNSSSEAGAEGYFTEAFREELGNAGAEGDSSSSVVARGEIANIGGGPDMVATPKNLQAPQVPGESAFALQSYRVDVSSCVRLFDGTKQLAEACVTGSEEYSAGPHPLGTSASPSIPQDPLDIEALRRVALRRLAKRMMKEAFERLAQGF